MKRKTFKFRPSLFWDVDVRTIDPKKHAKYVIGRVLGFGNDREVRSLWKNYSKNLIHRAITNYRGVDQKTRALWTLMTTTKK